LRNLAFAVGFGVGALGAAAADYGTAYLQRSETNDFSVLTILADSTEYLGVANDSHPTYVDQWYGARADGGVDYFRPSGYWSAAPLPNITNAYTSLATHKSAGQYMLGTLASGGIGAVYVNVVWSETAIVTNGVLYSDICTEYLNTGYDQLYFAARATGGVDIVYIPAGGGPWSTANLSPLGTAAYSSMAASHGAVNYLMAARVGGGIDHLYVGSGGWTALDMSALVPELAASEYVSVESDPQLAYSWFCARAEGGVDRLFLDGTWQVETLSDYTIYHDIGASSVHSEYLFGAPSASEEDHDFDEDGIPDWWEARFSGSATGLAANADIDAGGPDGASNLAEYISDTNPTHGESVLRINAVTLGGTDAVIAWQGGTAAVQYVEILADGDPSGDAWTTVFTNDPLTGVNETWTNASVTATSRWYRIRAMRP
jgi:hypothetical protein